MPGLKMFGWGPDLNPSVYTDGDSSYAELWGGVTPTFWDYALFPPNGALGWTEKWQPVAHTGGVSVASPWGTVSVDGNIAHVLPIRRTEGATLLVTNPSTGTTSYHFDAYPDAPATIPLAAPADSIEVLGADGASLLKGNAVR
jgi:hypothetical protein